MTDPRTEAGRERIRRFLEGWAALGSTTSPDVVTEVWVKREDEPRELRVADLRLVLEDRTAALERLRAVVEGLPVVEYTRWSALAYSDGLDRAAVLHAIDEEAKR